MSSSIIGARIKDIETQRLVPPKFSRTTSTTDLSTIFIDFVCAKHEPVRPQELETSALLASPPAFWNRAKKDRQPSAHTSSLESSRQRFHRRSIEGQYRFKDVVNWSSRCGVWSSININDAPLKHPSYKGTSSGWNLHLFKNDFRYALHYDNHPALAIAGLPDN